MTRLTGVAIAMRLTTKYCAGCGRTMQHFEEFNPVCSDCRPAWPAPTGSPIAWGFAGYSSLGALIDNECDMDD